MSLQDWLNNGWLRTHKTDRQEMVNLLAIADRDISDAAANDISDDWKFGIAYNAALKLCTMMLYARGFRPMNNLAHHRTLMAIEYSIGPHRKEDAIYLDACRAKRNTVEYDNVGGASKAEAEELLEFTRELRQEVLDILAKQFPELNPVDERNEDDHST